MVRRRWDYVVRWLMGAQPPHEYLMHPPENPGDAAAALRSLPPGGGNPRPRRSI